jgi:hypothetical protein
MRPSCSPTRMCTLRSGASQGTGFQQIGRRPDRLGAGRLASLFIVPAPKPSPKLLSANRPGFTVPLDHEIREGNVGRGVKQRDCRAGDRAGGWRGWKPSSACFAIRPISIEGRVRLCSLRAHGRVLGRMTRTVVFAPAGAGSQPNAPGSQPAAACRKVNVNLRGRDKRLVVRDQ